MGFVDYALIALIAAIVLGAGYFIFKAKKNGKKCIGCPHAAACGSCCQTCKCSKETDPS